MRVLAPITRFDGTSCAMWYSAVWYPAAQNNFAATTSLPVAMPRQPGGSNLMNHSCSAESRIVKPGVTPSLLADTTVHGPACGAVAGVRARATSAGVSGMRPARFTKKGPSGTSSTVLTFLARWPSTGSPGFENRFSSVWYTRSGS